MANKWKEFRMSLSPEREARLDARVKVELAKMPLAELRRAREMTQVRLAEVLQVNQGAVSKLEQRSDMYLSTLRSYVEAMGGQIEIRAVFPNGEMMLESLMPQSAKKPVPAKVPRIVTRSGKTGKRGTFALAGSSDKRSRER